MCGVLLLFDQLDPCLSFLITYAVVPIITGIIASLLSVCIIEKMSCSRRHKSMVNRINMYLDLAATSIYCIDSRSVIDIVSIRSQIDIVLSKLYEAYLCMIDPDYQVDPKDRKFRITILNDLYRRCERVKNLTAGYGINDGDDYLLSKVWSTLDTLHLDIGSSTYVTILFLEKINQGYSLFESSKMFRVDYSTPDSIENMMTSSEFTNRSYFKCAVNEFGMESNSFTWDEYVGYIHSKLFD